MKTKMLMFPDVPVKFAGAKMPAGFVNDVRGWAFSRQEVADAKSGGNLLTLDIDMAGKGACSLRCGHCFRRTPEFRTERRFDLNELMRHLGEAKALGLRSVKLIGPGEPLEDVGLLPFLRMLREMDVIPLIFTKGHVLGNDRLSARLHGIDGRALAQALDALGASILLGTTSFNPEQEGAIVGRKGYHAARNEAILRLIEAGFNEFAPGEATRLAFIATPLTPQNIAEAFEIHVWARERHIQPVIAPTMIAGRALDRLCALVPQEDEMLELYVRINMWAMEHGVMTPDGLSEQGIAAYAGAAPCNQVAVGLFLRGDGKVLRCPGDDISIQGDLHERPLAEIWAGSENLRVHAGRFNNGCPPKEGKSFPDGFFAKVMDEIRRRLR